MAAILLAAAGLLDVYMVVYDLGLGAEGLADAAWRLATLSAEAVGPLFLLSGGLGSRSRGVAAGLSAAALVLHVAFYRGLGRLLDAAAVVLLAASLALALASRGGGGGA